MEPASVRHDCVFQRPSARLGRDSASTLGDCASILGSRLCQHPWRALSENTPEQDEKYPIFAGKNKETFKEFSSKVCTWRLLYGKAVFEVIQTMTWFYLLGTMHLTVSGSANNAVKKLKASAQKTEHYTDRRRPGTPA